jgi:hypothetical protein
MSSLLSALLERGAPCKLKLLVPAAAIAGVLSIGATPANAQTGSLAWADGTSDFFSQVDLSDPTDIFTVVFDPESAPGAADGVTLVSTANGVFTPDFAPAPPAITYGTNSVVGIFQQVASIDANTAIYELQGNTSFNFSNGVSIGLIDTTQFTVALTAGGTIEALLTDPRTADVLSFVTGLSAGAVIPTNGAFTFNDTAPAGGGSYSANIDVGETVPGPLPILGAGVAFGYSRKVRKRIKLGQTA